MEEKRLSMSILAKKFELLELRFEELKTMEPDVLNERLTNIEHRIFAVKEMLTTAEAAEYLGVSMSQVYKLTMNMEIPHYKPQGKMIYFNKEELMKWMRRHRVAVKRKRKSQVKTMDNEQKIEEQNQELPQCHADGAPEEGRDSSGHIEK